MGSVEWNKKEELVAEQALKHLKVAHLCIHATCEGYFHSWPPYRSILQYFSHFVNEEPPSSPCLSRCKSSAMTI